MVELNTNDKELSVRFNSFDGVCVEIQSGNVVDITVFTRDAKAFPSALFLAVCGYAPMPFSRSLYLSLYLFSISVSSFTVSRVFECRME